MDLIEFLIRVAVGAGLGALIGVEREVTGKEAGIRTHAMVGLGAALFTVVSAEAFPGGDPSRVAAQIVSGIGFLGAGAIFRSGPLIKGLTTAAGLWVAAAVGMTAGAGELVWGAVSTAVATLVLSSLRFLDTLVSRIRRGVEVVATVEPVGKYLTVRDQVGSIDPGVDLVDIDAETGTVTFLVGKDRAELLRHALIAMDDVVEARVVT